MSRGIISGAAVSIETMFVCVTNEEHTYIHVLTMLAQKSIVIYTVIVVAT